MISCPHCGGRLAPHSIEKLKSGEWKRRFRCTCCQRFRSAYSHDGESWKWDSRPATRPFKEFAIA